MIGNHRDVTGRKLSEILQQSLQKVREKIWAMRIPDDIEKVATTIRNCLKTLNIDFHGFGMNIVNQSDDLLVVTVYEIANNGLLAISSATAGEQIILDIWKKRSDKL